MGTRFIHHLWNLDITPVCPVCPVSEWSLEALQEKVSGLFSPPPLFVGPRWHQKGLVGRKRESGGKTNDEKRLLHLCAFIKYMERTRQEHLDSICFPLMASSVLFPDRGGWNLRDDCVSSESTPAIWACERPQYTHTHTPDLFGCFSSLNLADLNSPDASNIIRSFVS